MADQPEFLDLTPNTAPEPTPAVEAEPADSPDSTDTADQSLPPAAKPVVTFQGNSYDLAAVIGVTIGGMVLFSCLTCNLGYYCLPIAPIILGAIGLIAAKDAVEPDRTKLLSWLSLGAGSAVILLIILFVAAYIAFIVFAVMADSGGF
mgnify:CR=1 FL=1